MNRILIAGMGNVLRRDDGFGVEIAKRLLDCQALPPSVRVVEVGIGGIHLVQELMEGYDILAIIDAMERGSSPGTVHILETEVPDLADWPEEKRQDFLADMHYTTPSKALILAKALGVLPPKVFMIGCQPAGYNNLDLGFSPEVQAAIPVAMARIEAWLAELNQKDRKLECV